MNRRYLAKPIFIHNCAALVLLCLFSPLSSGVQAQAPKPEPDVVVFPNGEKLIGHFESFVGGAAKFKSDTLGEVIIDLAKVQEMRTSQKYAVIRKDLKLAKGERDGQIPVGTLSVSNKTVQVDAGDGKPVRAVAVGDLSDIVDEASFEKAFHRPGLFQNWSGAIAVGASIVEATQNSTSFNTSVALVRTVPEENWLSPRNRTLVGFSDSYGKVTQPGTPTVKTSIYHVAAERDEYFTSRVYALGSLAFDHNFSQGLDLQQLYGGGIGWSVIHKANETLDVKGSVDYEKQEFQIATQNQNLANSIFAELYTLKFAKGIIFSEQASASPAWTNMRAYSAYGSLGIVLPVHKRLGFTAGAIDSFLNDPPTGFKKNSVQFTTGLTYTLR